MSENEQTGEQFDDESIFDAAAEFDEAEEFDQILDATPAGQTIITKTAAGAAVREWAKGNAAEWARTVASYVSGTCALKLGKHVKACAAKRLRELISSNSSRTARGYLETLRDSSNVEVGLNVHLLIHVINVDPALLNVACPDDASPLSGRII